MAAKTYAVMNGAAPGAAAPVPITTGTAIKTHIQLATNTTTPAIRFVEWWAEFDGSTAATPIKVELIRHTGGAQTTLTAYAAGDIAKVNDPNAPASRSSWGRRCRGSPTPRPRSPRPRPCRWRRTSCRPPPGSTSSSRSAGSLRYRCRRSRGSAPPQAQR